MRNQKEKSGKYKIEIGEIYLLESRGYKESSILAIVDYIDGETITFKVISSTPDTRLHNPNVYYTKLIEYQKTGGNYWRNFIKIS